MTRLELTSEEHEILLQVLHNYLATLEVEINHADHAEFKAMLKQRRRTLTALLERMSQATVTTIA